MKKFILGLALLTGVVLTGNAWANYGGSQCPAGGDHKACGQSGCEDQSYPCPIVDKAMKKACFYLENQDELGLSEEQVKSVKDIKMWFKKQMIRGQADMQIMMLDMNAKLSEETVDVEGTGVMIDEWMAGMAKEAKASLEAYAKLKAVLTPDQHAKAKEIWKKK